MNIIIIDDEQQSINALIEELKVLDPLCRVVGTAGGVEEGLALISSIDIDLVFLDIQMPDGTGFDLLKRLDRHDFHVVFLTAYSKYAITAFRFGALDFLEKPINPEELKRALTKSRKKVEEKQYLQQLEILFETIQQFPEKQLPTRIGISTLKDIVFKPVSNIVYLKAYKNFTDFMFTNGENKITSSKNIGEYEKQFGHYKEFMRVHRSFIANLLQVERYKRADGGSLVMKSGDEVLVSRMYRDKLLKRLGEV